MHIKAAAVLVVSLFLVGMLTSALIQPVRASETVYIRPDGTVDPKTAPIQRSGDLYTFTGNTYGSVVVERNDIVVNGAGYIVQGMGVVDSVGMFLGERKNVTVRGVVIREFQEGICLSSSSNNSICENFVVANKKCGVYLFKSSDNILAGNWIENNLYGVGLDYSSSNNLFHNNFLDNTLQVHSSESVNTWDADYPCGGNYWSDYCGVDKCNGPKQEQPGSDGIGDTPRKIDESNMDRYPLMELWSPPPMVRIFMRLVVLWQLSKGTENSLTSKLEESIRLFNGGNDNGAVHKLADFALQVNTLKDAQKSQQLYQTLSTLMKSIHNMTQAIINNIR